CQSGPSELACLPLPSARRQVVEYRSWGPLRRGRTRGVRASNKLDVVHYQPRQSRSQAERTRLAQSCQIPYARPTDSVVSIFPGGAPSMPFPQPFRGKIYDDVSQTIGHTPLIRLRRVVGHAKAAMIVKPERLNPMR